MLEGKGNYNKITSNLNNRKMDIPSNETKETLVVVTIYPKLEMRKELNTRK